MLRTIRVLFAFSLLVTAPTQGFEPDVHIEATEEGLAITLAELTDGSTIEFTGEAITQVAVANKLTDSFFGGLFDSEKHFDNELMLASSRRLVELKEQVVNELTTGPEPDGEGARRLLGTALHTLQDFYAHSNWAERESATINTALGRDNIGNVSPLTATCLDDEATLIGGVGPVLTTGYFPSIVGTRLYTEYPFRQMPSWKPIFRTA